uniref:Dimethylglycine dehydrogenase n=1 Tax=Macrostomum lignano TaxID=282301 RepID=A0A1I8IES6_9PLAT
MMLCTDWYDNGVPDSFGRELFEPDLGRIMPHLERAMEMVPAMQNAEIQSVISGPITYNAENAGLIGPVEGPLNYWLLGGLGYGIIHGGGVGKYVADWIRTGEPPYDLIELDANRYGCGADRSYTHAKSRETYGLNNAVGYPKEERFAGRPTKRAAQTSALYDELKSAGAEFGFHNGWEQPHWFGLTEEERRYEPSFRRGNWFPAMQRECEGVLNRAGVMDITPFSKFEISGPRAGEFLDLVTANRLPKVNRTCITHMLTPRGRVFSEMTLTCLPADDGQQKFLALTGSGSEMHDLIWLKDWRHKLRFQDGVKIDNVTDSIGCLSVAGPLSREILQSLTSESLDAGSYPFLQAKQLQIDGVDCLAIRISYTGELGWELYCGIGELPRLYKSIWRSGQPRGLVNFGSYAMNSLRLEKGFAMWGAEMNCDTGPLEAGLGGFIRLGKSADFVGKAAVAEAKLKLQQDGARQLRMLRVDSVDVDPEGNESVWLDGKVVGNTTSGSYSFSRGHGLAFAYVPASLGAGTQLEVDLLGRRVPAVVLSKPPLLPEQARKKKPEAASLLHSIVFLFGGLVRVLHQHLAAAGNAPVVRPAHGGRVWPTAGRVQVLPVVPARPGSNPRFSAHFHSAAPGDVLLGAGWESASFGGELLGDGADVIGLEAAAAANVADAKVALRFSRSKPAFISLIASRVTNGSKWQLTPTSFAPARAIRTAQSPAELPCMSPCGPMHIVQATGSPVSSPTCGGGGVYSHSTKSAPSALKVCIWPRKMAWIEALSPPLSRVASIGKLVLAGIVSERLHHIRAGSEKLAMQLLHSFWVLDHRFRCPRPRLDVAALLQGEHEAAVSNDNLAVVKPLQNAASFPQTHPEFLRCSVAPVGKLVLAGIVSERLHHIRAGSEKLAMKLLYSFRVFDHRFRCPRPRLDVAALLQGEHEAAVSNDNLAVVKPLHNAASFVRHGALAPRGFSTRDFSTRDFSTRDFSTRQLRHESIRGPTISRASAHRVVIRLLWGILLMGRWCLLFSGRHLHRGLLHRQIVIRFLFRGSTQSFPLRTGEHGDGGACIDLHVDGLAIDNKWLGGHVDSVDGAHVAEMHQRSLLIPLLGPALGRQSSRFELDRASPAAVRQQLCTTTS